jgi:hypothetical protein
VHSFDLVPRSCGWRCSDDFLKIKNGPEHYASHLLAEIVSDGTITKYKLAQGGYLAVTETGMIIAGRLADDLIKRA